MWSTCDIIIITYIIHAISYSVVVSVFLRVVTCFIIIIITTVMPTINDS